MRILVLGSGGREHAIVHKLLQSSRVTEVVAAPGNGGTAAIARNVPLDMDDPDAVAVYAIAEGYDLVVIGPEGPLVAGVADACEAHGVKVFGPVAEAARLEGSKEFAKAVMTRHGIPCARSRSFQVADLAVEYLREIGTPIVVKADGLAAGKGVTVAMDMETAEAAIRECFDGRFGAAGSTVLVEEYLEGPECSLLAFTDGRTVVPMVPAQDHKRAFDDDEGPNTGGMGVFSPVPTVDEATLGEMTALLQRAVSGLYSDGILYSGVIYGGFILTADGPKVLEFNARFGDPETQVILPRMESDLLDVMVATADGRLEGCDVRWRSDAAVSVVLASGGYPGEYEKGKVIEGIEAAEQVPGVTVYHAGTVRRGDQFVTSGGRVLNVTALAPTLAEARARAYEAVALISFDGMFCRSDIGARAVAEAG